MMSSHRRVSFSGMTDKKSVVTERITTLADSYHLKIYRALNMSQNPTIKPVKDWKM